ncbi:4-hydroxy-tetrahydrodipicolinate synthase 2 [Durusdinium trenchii]|uniref:Chloroplastic (HTPA synthase 2) n=1 Tax=Durusdinium trenchii TaxID=1381693 RepID=A0ABP0L1A2_9DINO
MAEATLALRKACKTASSCEGFGGLLVKGLAIKIFSRRKTIVELLSSVQRNTLFSTLCFAHFGGRRSTNFGLKAAIVFVSLPNEDAPHDVSVEVRLITAVKTPYQADGKIDLEAFDKLVEHQIANGVEGLIIGGTTGEGHLLSLEERIGLVSHSKACPLRKGRQHRQQPHRRSPDLTAAGMDAALLINPYYGKTSDSGIVMHLEAALKFGPAFIYNVPGRTGQDIKPEVIMKIKDHPHFIGVKVCLESVTQELSDQGICCWSGNDDQMHQSRHKCGAVGVISVTSNVVPGLVKRLMTQEDEELNAKLGPLYKWLFTDPNPIGVNTMLMMLGAAKPIFRLPYTFVPRDRRLAGLELVKSIGLEWGPFRRPGGGRGRRKRKFLFSPEVGNLPNH